MSSVVANRRRYFRKALLCQVGVQHRSRFDLAPRHQVAVAVERDRDRRVAEISAQGLGIQPGGDADAGVGMATLVEAEGFEARLFPARVGATTQDAGVGRPLRVVGARKEQPAVRVVEQDEMVYQERGEFVDDRHAARLA